MEILEFNAEGEQLARTYGEIRQTPTLPRIVAEHPGEAVIVMTGGSTVEDAVGRILDLRTLELGPEMLVHAMLKLGYWQDPT